MPGSTPPTSQLEWLSSTTAMIVLFWSRATRDLLSACPGEGRGHSAGASRHSIVRCSDEVAILAARPIASLGPPATVARRVREATFATPAFSRWRRGSRPRAPRFTEDKALFAFSDNVQDLSGGS